MNFNPDPSKQAQEVIFSRKIKKSSHPVLIFNTSQVIQNPYKKHLGLFFDEKLSYIGLLRKLQKCLPIRSLVTIYKSLIILIMEMLPLIRRIVNHSMKA